MPTSDEYLLYVLDLLKETPGITHKKMMGEFLLYQDGVLFGGIYDDRFLIKKTAFGKTLNLHEAIPYPDAKPMLLMDSEDPDEIKRIVLGVVSDLRNV